MKPILFTRENREKTRTGAKTQTRRVATDNLPVRALFDEYEDCDWRETTDERGNPVPKAFGNEMWWEEVNERGEPTERYFIWNAPYRVGEVRYLCEPYQIIGGAHRRVSGTYLDDGKSFDVVLTPAEWAKWQARKQPYGPTQARFMYKSLARTFVEITDLRRQPLQDISEVDAQAEGIEGREPNYVVSAVYRFAQLWNSINAARGHGFDTNPTVLVVEYKLVTP